MKEVRIKVETVDVRVKPSRTLKEEVKFEEPTLVQWFDEDLVKELARVIVEEIEASKCRRSKCLNSPMN